MISFSKIPPTLAAELARYRSNIIDASIVGHSTRARSLRLEAAGALMQANVEENSPLFEQATLFKKNHFEATQHGEQEKAKEWLLAAYAAYQILLYGPVINDAAKKAMEQRVLLASHLTKNPQEQDCREQAAFHAENVVDYLLRASEAKHSKNNFLISCWEEVAQGAREASSLWIKAANSLCSYSFFGLIPLLRIEVVRHAENKNKRKLLRIASYFSTLLSHQQWKDPLTEKKYCRKKILQATSIGNIALASYWRLVEKEIDCFISAQIFSAPNDAEHWCSFVLDSTTLLQAFLYGISNTSFHVPATSWIFATDERLEAAANYRYWVMRSQFSLKDQPSDWLLRLTTEEFSSSAATSAQEHSRFWEESAHDYRAHATEVSTETPSAAWEEAARRAEQLVLLWKKIATKKKNGKSYYFSGWFRILFARSAEKKLQHHLRSILMQTISFCLPAECTPDLECEQAWREGKLVPRIEFTMFYSWVYQSWQRLQQASIDCSLSTKLLEPGVIVTLGNYLITSLGLDSMMPMETFLVDVTADRAPHPGAQLHVVENKMQAQLLPHAIFIPHWPQRGLIPRDPSRDLRFENVVFFGEPKNLAPELRSKVWQQRLSRELGISFFLQGNQGWHDYSNVDAVIAIRSFSSSRYLKKPATKLYNAWHAGVPFIGGRDTAYATDGRPGIDYLIATSPEEVFTHLRQLKENPHLRWSLVQEGSLSAKKFTHEVILEHWKKLIQETIPKNVAAWQKKSKWNRRLFFMRQYFACLLFSKK